MFASVGLAVMSLPSHFMATPMEQKAYQIMQKGVQQDISMNDNPNDVVIMSHCAQRNTQELKNKLVIMILSAACFFMLFFVLLILNRHPPPVRRSKSCGGQPEW